MISDPTRRYLQQIDSFFQPEAQTDVPKIHVDYVASKIAGLYETLRQVIDYQEEHLLKKNTIERVLKRRLLLSSDPGEIAQPLVFELIRGGYFANDKIPETKIGEIKGLLAKYLFLMEYLTSVPEKNGLVEWLKGLAASEIEEKLSSSQKQTALLNYMVEELFKRLVFPEVTIEDGLKEELIFIACQKALLKADQDLLSWRLLKLKFPEFANSPTVEFLVSFSQNLPVVKKGIDQEMSHVLVKRILRTAQRFTPGFILINDIVSDSQNEAKAVFEKPDSLEPRLKFTYEKRYKLMKRENRRWGFRWVISILLSKMFLAFLIEVPYDRLHNNFSPLAMAVNLFVPPFLMFLIIASIFVPKEKNKKIVCDQVMAMVYPKEALETIPVKKPAERSGWVNLILRFIYVLSSVTVFGSVFYLLLKINFSWLSIIIFLAFFSLIAFSGMKIEASTKQLKAEDREKEEGITTFIADIFFLPFRNAGKWLSGQLQKYNLVILILNLFFEAPLQIFFEFVESWRGYLKSKKEELE